MSAAYPSPQAAPKHAQSTPKHNANSMTAFPRCPGLLLEQLDRKEASSGTCSRMIAELERRSDVFAATGVSVLETTRVRGQQKCSEAGDRTRVIVTIHRDGDNSPSVARVLAVASGSRVCVLQIPLLYGVGNTLTSRESSQHRTDCHRQRQKKVIVDNGADDR